MSKRKHRWNHHHIIPKSRADEGFATEKRGNILRIRVRLHDALHAVFDNLTPQMQLDRLLSINETVMSEEAVKKLKELIEMERELFYKSEFFTK